MQRSGALSCAIKAYWPDLASAAAFSLGMNILYLAAPIYMMQVYDRVLTGRSELTLLMLTIGLVISFLALAGLELARAQILLRTALALNHGLSRRVFAAMFERAIQSNAKSSTLLREFDTFTNALSGQAISALLDLPWTPIYVIVLFALHPALGTFALCTIICLIALAWFADWWVRAPLARANSLTRRSYAFAEMSLRNAEVVEAMGMTAGLFQRWARDRLAGQEQQRVATGRSSILTGSIRFVRLSTQSLILGLGAYLVIEHSASGGAMFAASLLLGRALLPIEQIIGSWRGLLSLSRAHDVLETALQRNSTADEVVSLPRPIGRLTAENVGYAIPAYNRPILNGLNFCVNPGEILGIVGPSGSGKSTLVRQLIGVLTPTVGCVRLDDANVATWSRDALGKHIGYLPQDIELFSDTVAANIRRFDDDNGPKVIAAARLVGAHELILRLPQGYATLIGEDGNALSGGIRQRIALARAVYGDPSLIVLDEPSSNLDAEGDHALERCVLEMKRRGTAVVIVSHRPTTLRIADKLLVMRGGTTELYGPAMDVVARINGSTSYPRRGAGGAA